MREGMPSGHIALVQGGEGLICGWVGCEAVCVGALDGERVESTSFGRALGVGTPVHFLTGRVVSSRVFFFPREIMISGQRPAAILASSNMLIL